MGKLQGKCCAITLGSPMQCLASNSIRLMSSCSVLYLGHRCFAHSVMQIKKCREVESQVLQHSCDNTRGLVVSGQHARDNGTTSSGRLICMI